MIAEKKYFSIAEVSGLTGLPAHKLRYIEKSNQALAIVKMRGRRYYTKESIEYLKQNHLTDFTTDDAGVNLDKDKVIETETTISNPDSADSKATFPEQLNLGIESFSKCFIGKEEKPSLVQPAGSGVFTEIEFQEISIVLRIDSLLDKLYKLTASMSFFSEVKNLRS